MCVKEGRLLCIGKTRGPYRGRYDLPGGGQESGESLVQTLKRELLEETGYKVKPLSQPSIADVFVQELGQETILYHQFALYDIELLPDQGAVASLALLEGKNDSSGAFWVPLDDLTVANASPLILWVKASLTQSAIPFEAIHYQNWQVKQPW